MKMTYAGTASISNYASYSKNCNLNQVSRPYMVPVPSLSDVQLFVNFGTVKPAVIKFTIIGLCDSMTEVVTTECFIIGNNKVYWYGVFTRFASAHQYKSFLFALEVTDAQGTASTYFSEQYTDQIRCDELAKVQVCYPANYNAEDLNDIFIGGPDLTQGFSGKSEMRYTHRYWVRFGQVVETSNKISFTSNSRRNFATKVNKVFEFRTELVPGWYKDYLLAVYFRGNFTLNDVEAKASDLAFENVFEDADLWKPFVKLDKELKGAFGCSPIVCEDPCTPCCDPAVTSSGSETVQPCCDAVVLSSTSATVQLECQRIRVTVSTATPQAYYNYTDCNGILHNEVIEGASVGITFELCCLQYTLDAAMTAEYLGTCFNCTNYQMQAGIAGCTMEWEDCETGAILSRFVAANATDSQCARDGTLIFYNGSGTITGTSAC